MRVIAGVMGALLARMGKEVTVLFDYDSSVRGSMSDAFLIFDDEPIANPVVEEADIMLKLADKGHLRISGRKVVADLGLDVPGAEQIPFASLGCAALRQGAVRQHDRAGAHPAPRRRSSSTSRPSGSRSRAAMTTTTLPQSASGTSSPRRRSCGWRRPLRRRRFQMNTAATSPDVRPVGGGLDASALPADVAETG